MHVLVDYVSTNVCIYIVLPCKIRQKSIKINKSVGGCCDNRTYVVAVSLSKFTLVLCLSNALCVDLSMLPYSQSYPAPCMICGKPRRPHAHQHFRHG